MWGKDDASIWNGRRSSLPTSQCRLAFSPAQITPTCRRALTWSQLVWLKTWCLAKNKRRRFKSHWTAASSGHLDCTTQVVRRHLLNSRMCMEIRKCRQSLHWQSGRKWQKIQFWVNCPFKEARVNKSRVKLKLRPMADNVHNLCQSTDPLGQMLPPDKWTLLSLNF